MHFIGIATNRVISFSMRQDERRRIGFQRHFAQRLAFPDRRQRQLGVPMVFRDEDVLGMLEA